MQLNMTNPVMVKNVNSKSEGIAPYDLDVQAARVVTETILVIDRERAG